MALEKPRQQPAHCLFPTCSWALERHGKNYIWIVTHPFHSFVGGFWRLTPADLTWCGMMRKDVVCWACWFLVLVCWCFCFVLEVARCMGLLKRTQLSVFIFVAEVSAKCGPRSGTRNTLSMCATANLGIRVGHTTIGARVEQVKGFLRKDLETWDILGWFGPSGMTQGGLVSAVFFKSVGWQRLCRAVLRWLFAGASASIRSLRCVAQRTMDQVPYSVENYEGPTVRI